MSSGQWQMLLFSTAVGLIGVAGFVYVLVTQPAYLHASREGVPYFTPKVVDPQGGPPLDVNMLVQHYKQGAQ